jgi:hypothetical protein
MPSQTWVARFVVDHGQVTEEGGRLRTFQRRRLDEPDTDLHLLAEPSGPKADEFGSQALDAIGRDFVKDTLSLTGGLQRALSATNQVLLDWNRRSIAREQVSVGVVAAVLRGSTVYLAQAGPTLVFTRLRGKLSRLVPRETAATALGEGSIEPELRRLDLEPGDVVIASSLALESLMDEDALQALLERGTDVALPELYLATRDQANFALFAITRLDDTPDPDTAGEATTAESSAAAASGAATSGPVSATATVARAPAPANGAAAAPEPVLTFEPQEESVAAPVLTMPEPLDISRPVVRLRNDQFSGRADYPRTTGGAGQSRLDLPAPRILGLAAVAAVILFIAAFTVPNLIHQNRQEQTTLLVSQALSLYTSVPQEPDNARKRILLEETRRLAGEALRIDASNSQALQLRQLAGEGLAVLNNVVDLGPMQTLTTLGRQVTGDVAIDRLVVAGGAAFMLDSRGRRVISVPLNPLGAPTVIFADGETYGGTVARRPLFMSWDASGGRLLVLDQERKLFEVRPGAVQPLALRRTTSWASVADISAYDGNLYVLDPKANQIYKYLPAANGFDSEPTGLLPGATVLTSGKALSVLEDLFVLTDDGKVRRFRSGSDVTLPLSGIDRPLSSPSTLIAVSDSDQLFIADSGNKRVVVSNRDGAFQRQFVSNTLTDVKAIAVAPGAGQLYAVVGDALLTSPLPK